MDKGTRVWQISAARENLRRHGIRARYFIQFGYPGETWTEIEKTIALIRDTQPNDIGRPYQRILSCPGRRAARRSARRIDCRWEAWANVFALRDTCARKALLWISCCIAGQPPARIRPFSDE
jgi:hypothetical protein